VDGLETFSHLWVIFLFDTSRKYRSKVRPPKLRGEKTGVFASRSPHRPNPIGISVVKIISVRDNVIVVGGIDIIDRTQIIDIKPYHPADSPPIHTLHYPDWVVSHDPLKSQYRVAFEPQVLESIQMSTDFTFFETSADFVSCLTESLQLDPRSTQQVRQEHGGIYQIFLDNLEVLFSVQDDTVNVIGISKKKPVPEEILLEPASKPKVEKL